MTKRVALFAGSFDPYTNGHHAIVKKAAALFDGVVVLLGVNVAKRRAFDAAAMADAIRAALRADGLENVTVEVFAGLVSDYCAERSIRWYVRGLRNGADYDYEENTARINARLNPALETIYLRGDDTVVSSSMVRELLAFGKPVGQFVPGPILEIIENTTR